MKRKTTSTIGLQFVIHDDEEPDEMPERFGRVFALTVPDLRRMLLVLDSLNPLPDGLSCGISAVRQGRRSTRTIGLQYVLVDDSDGEWLEPVSRVFDVTIIELRRMVDVLDSIGEPPAGFSRGVRAVRRKRSSPLQQFPHIWRRLK